VNRAFLDRLSRVELNLPVKARAGAGRVELNIKGRRVDRF
jgi:hypothetical protein